VQHKQTGANYALKVVDKHLVLRHNQTRYISRERRLLDSLEHPGIVRLHFTFQDEDSLYFGLELCPHGKERLSCSESRQVNAHAMSGMVYCLLAAD
jgi:3-phosphoinositide dependent protein kinase-1